MADGGGSFQIAGHVPERSAKPMQKWFDLTDDLGVDGFEVHLSYMSKKTLDRWARDCTKMARNPATKKKEPKLDERALYRLYAAHIFLGWRGLTVGGLKRMIELHDIEGVPDNTPVEFSAENVVYLLENAYDVDAVVTNIVKDISNFLSGGPRETTAEEHETEDEEIASGN